MERGVCTDVVIRALRDGLDLNLQKRVHEDESDYLPGDIPQTYVDLRAFQMRLAIARRNAESQQRNLALVRRRFDAGDVPSL